MLSKKCSLLFTAQKSAHSFHSASGSTTSSPRRRDGTRQQRCCAHEQQRHATIAHEPNDHDEEHHEPKREPDRPPWPSPTTGQQHPTPYQIFAMKSNAVYTKAKFYELVKLYHPDLTSNSTCSPSGISHQVRTERYRLIVAAHTILSDPVRRSAYDRFGAGWNGKAEVDAAGGTHPGPGPFSHGHGWNSGQQNSDPIWNNATWEDWEKFYAWRARQKGDGTNNGTANMDPQNRQGLYMNNSSFVILVTLLALLGSTMNYKRGQDAGTYFVEQRDLVHDRAAKELRKVRQEMQGMRGRDERIQWFLRNREATMGSLSGDEIEAMREEKASRVLSNSEVCRSDGVSGKGT